MSDIPLGTAVTMPFADPTLSDDFTDEDGDIGFDPLEPTAEAPYGYTKDRKTGEYRPKKLPGRPGAASAPEFSFTPGNTPTVDELKAEKTKHAEDRAPAKPKRTRSRKPAEDTPEVPYKAGVITKGMNKLYVRAGKLVRAMDYDIGQAIIASTRKETDDDVTVGEAWEELARTNPRVRAFLMKLMTGGAWTQLFMAHAPIFLAVIMKESIRKHIPMGGLIDGLLGNDEETGAPSEVSQALGGLQPADMEEVMKMAQQFMPGFLNNLPRQPVVMTVPEEPDEYPVSLRS